MGHAGKLGPEQVRELYENHMEGDFPADELKPLSYMLRMMEKGDYECLGWHEGADLRAYACLVLGEDGDSLLDYLAVCRGYRAGGVGSRVLRDLREWYGREPESRGIWIECEAIRFAQNPEEEDVRRRRIDFYERNGAVVTDVASRLFGVEYSILYYPLGGPEDTGDAMGEAGKRRLERIYRRMFPDRLFGNRVALRLEGEREARA